MIGWSTIGDTKSVLCWARSSVEDATVNNSKLKSTVYRTLIQRYYPAGWGSRKSK